MALTTKNSIERAGVNEKAPIMFQTERNVNAPTIKNLGGTTAADSQQVDCRESIGLT